MPAELWGAKLALQLLQQRLAGGESPYAPYISHLPVGFPGIPMFFGRDAVMALEYPPVVEQVSNSRRWVVSVYLRDVVRSNACSPCRLCTLAG